MSKKAIKKSEANRKNKRTRTAQQRRKAPAPDSGRTFRVNCFEAAVDCVDDLNEPTAVIVHGLPIGRGVDNLGKRYWHAWVELNGKCYDFSHGNRAIVPAELYYSLGKIDPNLTLRFTVSEAVAEMEARKHYGPWVDNFDDYSEVD